MPPKRTSWPAWTEVRRPGVALGPMALRQMEVTANSTGSRPRICRPLALDDRKLRRLAGQGRILSWHERNRCRWGPQNALTCTPRKRARGHAPDARNKGEMISPAAGARLEGPSRPVVFSGTPTGG